MPADAINTPCPSRIEPSPLQGSVHWSIPSLSLSLSCEPQARLAHAPIPLETFCHMGNGSRWRRTLLGLTGRRSCAQDSNVSAFPHSVARSGIREHSSVAAAGRVPFVPFSASIGIRNDRSQIQRIRPPTTCLGPGCRDDPGSDGTGIGRIELCANLWGLRLVLYSRYYVKPAPFPTGRSSIVTFLSATARLGG